MHIETRAELLKLSRLLESDEGSLDFLDGQNLDQLAQFRNTVSSFFYAQHQDSYQRLAGISKLVPTGASAKLATTVLGSVLAAGIASELPAERAIKLSDKLPDDFLAKLCIHLEPSQSRDLLAAMPDKIVARVAQTLLAMGEHITLARFVAVIKPSALQAITATVNDGEAMVKIALYLEDKSKLDTLLGLLSEAQQRATLQAATDQQLWPAVLSLNGYLNTELRGRMGNMVAEQGETVLNHILDVASEQALWTNLLQAVNAMDNSHQQVVVNLAKLQEAKVMESLVGTVAAEGSWDEFLTLIPLLDQAHLTPALDVLVEHQPAALANALEHAHDSHLLGFFGHLPDSDVARLAQAIQGHAASQWQAFAERNSDAHEIEVLKAQIG
ncbi:hypothetical protein A15D_00397 [Alcanivorax sp. MD8A]|uniref:hypothetical protein n=1 Tax=Alcanivorax sp. MD8A TaxID=1177157 RepID=UPI000C999FB0|nr:hypothetical protein [Alcanivorax sp. MD8A]MEE2869207.1 hypothetical protein [Pseudomonadota bacterium]PNE04217.1 hypothetical protein A15D_00397 [Alcanivorax sp. MD8A]